MGDPEKFEKICEDILENNSKFCRFERSEEQQQKDREESSTYGESRRVACDAPSTHSVGVASAGTSKSTFGYVALLFMLLLFIALTHFASLLFPQRRAKRASPTGLLGRWEPDLDESQVV